MSYKIKYKQKEGVKTIRQFNNKFYYFPFLSTIYQQDHCTQKQKKTKQQQNKKHEKPFTKRLNA